MAVFQEIESAISTAIQRRLRERFDLTLDVSLEQPKQASFGELAIPVAFQLARQLKRPPRRIAEELAAGLDAIAGVSSFEIAGNGYINVRLDRAAYAQSLFAASRGGPAPVPGKIV